MTRPLGERRPFVAAAAVASIVLGIGASILLPVAYGFDLEAFAHPGSIVDQGQGVAQLLRWGALLDMASYVLMAVVVVYFHHLLRARNPELVTLLTACGLGYVLIGSIAGALMAAVGPPRWRCSSCGKSGWQRAYGAVREVPRRGRSSVCLITQVTAQVHVDVVVVVMPRQHDRRAAWRGELLET